MLNRVLLSMEKNRKIVGFTLFELLISISIIGILVALAVVSYSSAQKKARDARMMQDLGNVQKAAEQYFSLANGVYPAGTAPTNWLIGGQQVLEQFPVTPKGSGYTVTDLAVGTTGYCACAKLDNNIGNAVSSACVFVGAGGTGPFFCVKNQQ